MEYNPRDDIKGDLRIIARGSTALVQKEVQSQRLLQFPNPMDAPQVDRNKLLREIAQTLDIDPDEVIKSEERLQAEQALQNQMLAGMQQGGAGAIPEAGMAAGQQLLASRLDNARELLEAATKRFQVRARILELRFVLELEETAKATLERERTRKRTSDFT